MRSTFALPLVLGACGSGSFVPVEDGAWSARAYLDHVEVTFDAETRASIEAARTPELLDARLVLDGDRGTLVAADGELAVTVERLDPRGWGRACPQPLGDAGPRRRPERVWLWLDAPLVVEELDAPVAEIEALGVSECARPRIVELQLNAVLDGDRFTMIELRREDL